MKFLSIILFIVGLTVSGIHGQERLMETEFFKLRNKIKEAKIVEMSEYCSNNYNVPCARDSGVIHFNYKFDNEGNLIERNDYLSGKLSRTINYERNENGDYVSKTYTNLSGVNQIWEFEYNSAGQKIRETCKNGDGIYRLNDLTYDSNGNLASQLADSARKWTFEYDDVGRLIETREWETRSNPVRCLKLTKYIYTNGLLTEEIVQDPVSFEVSKHFQYQYDANGYLVSILEKRTYWSSKNYGPLTSRIEEYKSEIVNDDHGFAVQKSTTWVGKYFIDCSFYEYVYRKD